MSAVTYRDLPNKPQKSRPRSPAVAFFAMAIGMLLWFFGALWTLEGAILGINTLLDWVTLSALAVPEATGYWVLLAVPLGIAFSRVEISYRPVRKVGDKWRTAGAGFWAVWLCLVAFDVGSTYIGYRNADHQLAMAQQLASYPVWAGLWAFVVTFGPEWLILFGLQLLRNNWKD